MVWANPPPYKSDPPELITEHFILISRQEAISQGLKHYFTGNPCPKGHIDELYVSNNTCRTCHRERSREYGRKNISRIVNKNRVKSYGISAEEFNNLLQSQNYKCSLCDDDLIVNSKQTHLDHCHKTGKIRNILCGKCNTGLGLFGDSIEKLEKAISYLKRHENGLG